MAAAHAAGLRAMQVVAADTAAVADTGKFGSVVTKKPVCFGRRAFYLSMQRSLNPRVRKSGHGAPIERREIREFWDVQAMRCWETTFRERATRRSAMFSAASGWAWVRAAADMAASCAGW